MAVHKPRALPPGGRIGILAPSGSVDGTALEKGLAVLEAQGFTVELAGNVLVRKGYLAGDEKERAAALLKFFRRGDIDAIFCARGGFGSMQLLPLLAGERDLPPKIFVGYSDVTVLLNWFLQRFRFVTFHGPMVAADLSRGVSESSKAHFFGMLAGAIHEWS